MPNANLSVRPLIVGLATAWLALLPGVAPHAQAPAAVQTSTQSPASSAASWHGVDRVLAFADVHGAFTELTQLLRETGVIDASLRWSAGKTHVVSLGDLLDRGDDSRKVMDLLRRLQGEAAAAGGKLHVVLGNHEAMNVLGDLRFVTHGEYAAYIDFESPEARAAARDAWVQANGTDSAAAFEARFPPGYFGHRAALGPNGTYGKWLLSLPAAVVVNDTLFLHGGPSAALAGMDVAALNLRYRTAMTDYLGALEQLQAAGLVLETDAYNERPQRAAQRLAATADASLAAPAAAPGVPPIAAPVAPAAPPDALAALVERFRTADDHPLLGPAGPNWNRGAALCNEVAEADVLSPLLRQFGVARVVVGHTPTRTRTAVSRFDGAVIKLDAGMNAAAYRGRAAALLIEHGKLSVRYPGAAAAVAVQPEGFHVAPTQIPDELVAAALREGEATVAGPGGPDRLLVTVAHAQGPIPAVFVAGKADASRKEVAAFRLDRLLRLGIVPATVEREVQGQAGTLQARPRQTVTQGDVQRQSLRAGKWCALEPQFQLVYAFDALIGNEGRTLETLLYDADEWFVYVTGHDQAFGTSRRFPAYLAAQAPAPGPELRKRLQELDVANVTAALGPVADKRTVRALLARRDALLALPLPAAAAR
jgi:hypothetical protein